MPATIDQLIVNGPYDEPTSHWRYDRESRTFSLEPGRRPAGYVVATPGSKSFDDPGVFRPLPLVNRIRPRVKAWREAGYPGVTGTTLRLLQHWRDAELWEERRFFFCQLEAIETLIWLPEAPAGERQGIDQDLAAAGDGGPFPRLCAKMATGSGKTLVMAMAIAWHILNRVANPQDVRFSKHVLVIAPGLTVRKRLAVVDPTDPGNYYDRFNMVPAALRERLRQGRVRVSNWHTLNWESDEQLARRRTVDKRGARSDAAYVRDVLGDLASASNLLVVNDEAHHLARAGRRQGARRVEGRGRGGHPLDRRARPHPAHAWHPHLLRLLGHAVRAVGPGEHRGGAVRLDRQRLQPERRDRVGTRQDAAGGHPRRRRARGGHLQVEALPHLSLGA
jgi:type III restriction enzyme